LALRFSLYLVCMQAAVGVSAPFFAVYMLRDLQYNYIQFMANTGTAVLMQFLMLNTWGRISDVFGNRLILVTTGSMIPFLPLLWLVSGNFWYLIGVQVISGFAWAGFSLSSGNFLYDLIPCSRRASTMAFHNVFVAIGVFLGGMLGVAQSCGTCRMGCRGPDVYLAERAAGVRCLGGPAYPGGVAVPAPAARGTAHHDRPASGVPGDPFQCLFGTALRRGDDVPARPWLRPLAVSRHGAPAGHERMSLQFTCMLPARRSGIFLRFSLMVTPSLSLNGTLGIGFP
jgi:hypothetical protein